MNVWDDSMVNAEGGPSLAERIASTRDAAERERASQRADGKTPSGEDARAIACVITKLDEAQMWAERIGRR